jgi:hypothetical protein
MPQSFPDKFRRLHEGEEFVRRKSIEAIDESEDLLAHAGLVEAVMDVIDHFCQQYPANDEDTRTVQLLGIRLFNGMASALKLLLSGYYETSALQQRDLLETIFLLDYFKTDHALIAKWRAGDERARRKDFAPAAVRTALDERDGFTERKREKAYKLLCELAGHPTYAGFTMLAPVPGGNAHCGPFFEFTAFKAVYEELAKHALQAGAAFVRFFEARDRESRLLKIGFTEVQGKWMQRFFGQPFDQKQIDDLRALVDRIGAE